MNVREEGFRVLYQQVSRRTGHKSAMSYPSASEPPCLAMTEAICFAEKLDHWGDATIQNIRVIDNRTGLPVDSIVRRKT